MARISFSLSSQVKFSWVRTRNGKSVFWVFFRRMGSGRWPVNKSPEESMHFKAGSSEYGGPIIAGEMACFIAFLVP